MAHNRYLAQKYNYQCLGGGGDVISCVRMYIYHLFRPKINHYIYMYMYQKVVGIFAHNSKPETDLVFSQLQLIFPFTWDNTYIYYQTTPTGLSVWQAMTK